MSFNGSGTFQINTAGQPVVTGTVISSTAFNALTADLATGLSTCVTKDGQTNPTANLPMAGYKLTGLGSGSAATDSATLAQVQGGTVSLIASISGTDTITGSLSPALTAYAAGQMFYFVAAGANTGAVTLNINSLGAKSVTRDGSTALVANDILSGEVVLVVYDGTRFQLIGPKSGDVVGPASATDNAVVRFDGTTGKLIQNSTGVTITDGGVLTTTTNASINGVAVGKGGSSGSYNTVVGDTAGNALTTAGEITLFGYRAGAGVTTGNGNTFFGANAGDAVTTGTYNTAIGNNAYPTGNYNNSIGIGLDAAVSANNYCKIGDGDVDAYAKSFTGLSDARDKADIQPTNLGLNFIMALQPRMYRWDMREFYKPERPGPEASQAELEAWREACKLSNLTHDGTHKRSRFHQGLVAQEVKEVLTTLGVDFGGFRDCEVGGGDAQMGLEYTQFIAPLIKAIQELKAEFDAYKSTHP
jgi:hypothetical protein